jgi:ABC-type nitrate/sulfonate/bicarbonate transport system permease component
MTRRGIAKTGRRAAAMSAALLATEIAGFLSMLAPVPLAWMWVGARVYEVTGSLLADMVVAFGGFFLTLALTMDALNRVDRGWVDLRRKAGHDQRQGALTQVVVVTTTFALIAFWIWFHILSNAFIIPFMPRY